LPKPGKTFFPGIKKAGITGIPAREKERLNFLRLSQNKDTFFLSVPAKISRKKKRSLKKYRINVIRVPYGDPVHYHSLKLSRLS
jgi:hypothetical protein